MNDQDRDRDWDAVWQAETHADEDGWYAEIRIPFSSIRYRPAESMTWGLQVYRYMHRRGEDTAWVIWDQETSGFVSRFGELTDIEGVRSPRQLEVLPYVVQRSTDPAEEGLDDGVDNFQNFGADIKYGITPDLTLNATFQPDFGQVEADPAVLNLSPFETFFDEKRPFFVEGNRFFQQRDFNMFYSRRIGTGDENSRIRFAGKITGKTAGNATVAALYASTDVTNPGQAYNFLRRGERTAHFLVSRVGKDFAGGNHRVHLMQTAVLRSAEREEEDDDGLDYRDGYTTGVDFDLKFRDRTYGVTGSFVGSVVDPAPVAGDPLVGHSPRYGTGGDVTFRKNGGRIRGAAWGRWEGNHLDLNDMGYLSSNDNITAGAWVGWRYVPGENPRLNNANLNFNFHRSWLYGGARVTEEETGAPLWDYGRGHPQNLGGNVNGYFQFRSYRGFWGGIRRSAERTDRYITRGGPLMTRPAETGLWFGGHTDGRKPLSFNVGGDYVTDAAGGYWVGGQVEAEWNASNSTNHSLEVEYWARGEKADYLDTMDREDPALGIGGSSYVFGDLEQKTFAVTLRSNLLFSRNQSLELYLQPYLSVGDYTNARELVTPNSYELVPYDADGFRAHDYDFLFTSANLNLVYRYEYRPGSTLYLVWTHSRSDFEERGDGEDASAFDNRLDARDLVRAEAENVLLAKVTYWFSL
jgi:hypothetical protein